MTTSARIVTSIAIAALAANADSAECYAEVGLALNGVYAVTSNGQWATTNDIYRDEAVVRSTWTITSSCRWLTLSECSGQVVSDQGWTAPLVSKGGEWRVERTIPNWEPCPDGSAAEGHQLFHFYPVDEEGQLAIRGSATLAGQDKTTGPSGACGINMPIVITMPLKLSLVSG